MVEKKKRGRGEGALFQRADGRWVGRVTLPNGERKQIVRAKYEDAVRDFKKVQVDVHAGRITTAKASGTVRAWLEYWIEEVHRERIDPGTYDDYERTIRLHIMPEIGQKKLAALTSEDVSSMEKAIQKKGRTRTAQIAHHVITRALNDAAARNKIPTNVAAVVPTPKHVKRKRDSWAPGTVQRIQAVAVELDEQNGTRMATRVAAAFEIGGRPGELIGLRLPYVSLKTGVADLAWQLQQLKRAHGCGDQKRDKSWPCGRKGPGWCPQTKWDLPVGFEHEECHRSLLFTRPKTEDGTRVVPIVDPFLTQLGEHIESDPWPNPHGLVWHHPDGRPISPREDHRYWAELLAAAGVEGDRYTARHTTGTAFLKAGVDRHVARDVLGHADEETTEIYQHVDLTLRREAIEKVSAYLRSTDTPGS